jgi:hypothetical protein
MTLWDDWWERLEPWWTNDLQTYTQAIAGMWDAIEPYASDPDNEIETWQALWDVDVAPLSGLPWLAQTVGEHVPVGYTADQARAWITTSPRWVRGTPQGIVNAVKRLLTGGQVVQFRERSHMDGTYDDDTISVVTYASETPNQAAVIQALRRNVPADIVVEYQVISQATWALVQAGQANWAALQSTYGPTWTAVAGAKPGFNVWA